MNTLKWSQEMFRSQALSGSSSRVSKRKTLRYSSAEITAPAHISHYATDIVYNKVFLRYINGISTSLSDNNRMRSSEAIACYPCPFPRKLARLKHSMPGLGLAVLFCSTS